MDKLRLPGSLITLTRGEFKRLTSYNIGAPSPLIIKLPLLRHRLGLHNLRPVNLANWLEDNGFIIIARGGDGSNSSWIIAIDPKDSMHNQFIASWCRARLIIIDILKHFQEYIEAIEGNKAVPPLIRAIIDLAVAYMEEHGVANDNEILKLADTILAFTLIDGADPGNPIILSIVNPKVKLIANPCEVVGHDGSNDTN